MNFTLSFTRNECQSIYFYISKAIDSVSNEWLLYKLKAYGVNGSPLFLMKRFLTNIFQIELLNSQILKKRSRKGGVCIL